MNRRKRNLWPSAALNNITYNDYITRLTELALNSIKWENMPDSVNVEFLEKQLFYKGFAIFFFDEILGYLTLNGALSNLDVYGYPTLYRAIGDNGYNRELTNANAVIIWNNSLHTPTYLTAEMFALRLYEIERTMDVNIKTQKTPYIIKSSEQQRLTLKNLFMKYDGNEPFIYGSDKLDLEGLEVINTNTPYLGDKLEQLKHNIFDDYLTFLGIENNNQDKKERLVATEASGNYGFIEAQRNIFLNARNNSCEQINKMFGLNISVRYNSDLQTLINNPYIFEGQKLGVDNIE